MWFRNLIVYRLPAGWAPRAAELEAQLATRTLAPCSPFEMHSRGWVAPSKTGRLLHTVNQQYLIALGVEQKLLPGSIIRQEAARRARILEQSQGFPVGRRQMRDLRLQVGEELRARALCRQRVTHAWLDPAGGWCVVDAASPGRAEELIETLRETLGSFAVQFLQTTRSAHHCMAAWLTQGNAPGRFSIEQDLELTSTDGSRASVRYTRCPLDMREIRSHLGGGKHPTRLGLSWSDRIAFVLTDKLQFKRVEFLEMSADDLGTTDAAGDEADAAAQFDIDFAVMAGELGRLLQEVVQALGGEELGQAAAA